MVLHVGHHAEQHIHVLREGGRIVTAGLHGDVGIEETETTGDVRQGVDGGPSQLTDQEGAHVLQLLEHRQRPVGHFSPHQAAVLHGTTVTHQHGGAHADHRFRAVHHVPHHAVQRHRLDDTVHVGTDEVLVAADVDAGVGTVGLCTTVHLVHEHQLAVALIRRLHHALDRLALHAHGDIVRDFDQLVFFDEDIQGAVGTFIVHDDHLVVRIVQVQQRVDAVDDHDFLVVGRRDHGHGRRQRGSAEEELDRVVIRHIDFQLLAGHPAHEHHDEVGHDQGERVGEDQVAEDVIDCQPHISSLLFNRLTPFPQTDDKPARGRGGPWRA